MKCTDDFLETGPKQSIHVDGFERIDEFIKNSRQKASS
jgi:hypothetical protein